MWRWTSDTRRCERTRTSLPAAVRQVRSRLTVPRRRSSSRLVGGEVGDRQFQRLVVDVQRHDLRVGDVDDRLSGRGEPKRLLGVVDAPRFVEPVEERAWIVGVAALLMVAAQPQVAVAEGEQGLVERQILTGEADLEELPRIGRIAELWQVLGHDPSRHPAPPFGEQLVEVVDDDIGPVLGEGGRDRPAIDTDRQRKATGTPGGDAGDGVLDDGRSLRRHAQLIRRGEERVRCRFARQMAGCRDVAVNHDVEAIGETRGIENFGCVARRGHHANADTAPVEGVEEADGPRIGLDPVSCAGPPGRRRSWRCPGSSPCRVRARRRRFPRAGRCRVMRGTSARRRRAASRRRRRGSRRR